MDEKMPLGSQEKNEDLKRNMALTFWQLFATIVASVLGSILLVTLLTTAIRSSRDPMTMCPGDNRAGFKRSWADLVGHHADNRNGFDPDWEVMSLRTRCHVLKLYDQGKRGYLSQQDIMAAKKSKMFNDRDVKQLGKLAAQFTDGIPILLAAEALQLHALELTDRD